MVCPIGPVNSGGSKRPLLWIAIELLSERGIPEDRKGVVNLLHFLGRPDLLSVCQEPIWMVTLHEISVSRFDFLVLSSRGYAENRVRIVISHRRLQLSRRCTSESTNLAT